MYKSSSIIVCDVIISDTIIWDKIGKAAGDFVKKGGSCPVGGGSVRNCFLVRGGSVRKGTCEIGVVLKGVWGALGSRSGVFWQRRGSSWLLVAKAALCATPLVVFPLGVLDPLSGVLMLVGASWAF